MLEAKYYDISNNIDPKYEDIGFVTMDKKEFYNKIKNYLDKHEEIKTGDIIFIGSHYETRQEYGFCLVINKEIKEGNYGPYLPLKNIKNLPENIKYGNILEIMKNDEDLYLLWYGDDLSVGDEIIEEYKRFEKELRQF